MKKLTIITDNAFDKAWKKPCPHCENMILFYKKQCHECKLKADKDAEQYYNQTYGK